MGKRKRELHAAALSLSLAVLLQGILCARLDRTGWGGSLQIGLVTVALAAATHELWRGRFRLDHHLDMLLVMAAFGGLGMLIGTALDMTLPRRQPPPIPAAQTPGATPNAHANHSMPIDHSIHAGHADLVDHSNHLNPAASPHHDHQSGLGWGGFAASLTTWMTALMLLAGIPPSWFLTRCANLARASVRRWLATHLAGNLGMLVGMIVAGRLFGHALGLRIGLPATGHHLAMVAGMLAGMALAQLTAETLLGLRPWRRI